MEGKGRGGGKAFFGYDRCHFPGNLMTHYQNFDHFGYCQYIMSKIV
jgi:hypothetical protein